MKKVKKHQTNLISYVIILVTIILLVFLSFMMYHHASLEMRFDALINWLTKIDNAIVKLDTNFEIVMCIFALYIAKCQLPIPLGALCVISGMVFPLNKAIFINIIFIAFFFSVKYFEGMWIGGGWARIVLNFKKMRFVRDLIHFKGNGNPYILLITRFIPSIPLGVVSKYYGSMRYDFLNYVILSVIGIAPRLYIYTKLGSVFYNPFAPKFISLLMIIVLFTGVSTLVFNIYYGRKSRQMNQTLLIYSEKQKYKIVF